MNILMMTNTYKPIVGGLEKSVESFASEFRNRGHQVIIVAPEYKDAQEEEGVLRIPSIQNINNTDYSLEIPIPGIMREKLGEWKPDLVHAHHPFLIGDTALRMAHAYGVPLVFTHHTLYEQNAHYVPGDPEAVKRFVIELSTGYANLADQVFAPSQSVLQMLVSRGVQSPIDVVPTGIDVKRFQKGSGALLRKKFKIPARAFVLGHLGRLAREKNLEAVAKGAIQMMSAHKSAHFLIVGRGPYEETLKEMFNKAGLSERVHFAGSQTGQNLIDAYHAMNVFVFASHSETQGLVLVEAMAAGVPVVAVDAPGVREVVKDQVNGRLLSNDNEFDMAQAIAWIRKLDAPSRKKIKQECFKTAEEFSMANTSKKALELYLALVVSNAFSKKPDAGGTLARSGRLVQAYWKLAKNFTRATFETILNTGPDDDVETHASNLDEQNYRVPLV